MDLFISETYRGQKRKIWVHKTAWDQLNEEAGLDADRLGGEDKCLFARTSILGDSRDRGDERLHAHVFINLIWVGSCYKEVVSKMYKELVRDSSQDLHPHCSRSQIGKQRMSWVKCQRSNEKEQQAGEEAQVRVLLQSDQEKSKTTWENDSVKCFRH